MAMITICLCNIYSKELDKYGDYRYRYSHKNQEEQWSYINSVNKSNGCIATMAHSERTSILREFFIKPHLDKDGYIKEYGKFSLEHDGEKIEYELVDKRS